MKIDPKTKLFYDIEPVLREEMLATAKTIVLNGEAPNPWPLWLEELMIALGYDGRNTLLLLSTVVPIRILLSLVLDQEAHTKKVETALVDALKGHHHGYKIQETTGLPITRCEEISDLFKLLAFGPETR